MCADDERDAVVVGVECGGQCAVRRADDECVIRRPVARQRERARRGLDAECARRVERVDVRRVRARLAQLGAPDAADGAAYLGGLQRTLRLLRHWFRFTRATAGDLDGVPVWFVDGGWAADYLGIVLPDLKDRLTRPGAVTPADLPDGVPWSIRLAISRGDLVLHRIEWLAIPGRRPVAEAPPEPIAVMELFDVEFGRPVDATAFFYQPAAEGLIDVTDMYVSAVSLMR